MISSNVFRCLRSRCLHQAATKADITSSNYSQATSKKQRQNTNAHLTQLIHANFPPSELCFAYGSGVFPQKNNNAAPDTMTDVIFVVRNSLDWHEKNLKQNPKHYALLMRFFGAGNCCYCSFLGQVIFVIVNLLGLVIVVIVNFLGQVYDMAKFLGKTITVVMKYSFYIMREGI